MATPLPLCVNQSYGTVGRQIDLISNFFGISLKTGQTHMYHVDFKPEIGVRKTQEKILRAVSEAKKFAVVFDGGSLCYSKTKLANFVIEIPLSTEKYAVEFKHVGTVTNQNTPPTVSHLFHIIIQRAFRVRNYVQIQRKYFDPKSSISIPKHGVEIWPGFSAAIVMSESGITLNIDVANKVLRTETALQFIRNAQRDTKGDFPKKINELLSGSVVMTRYNNRTYKVTKVDCDRNPSFIFENLGKKVSLAQYIKTKYGITLKDMTQPLLVSEKKGQGEILLVPECCCMTGLTDEMIKDFRVMQDVGEYTRVGPAARIAQYKSFRQQLDDPKVKQIFDEYGVEVEGALKPIKGRVLDLESIFLKQKSQKTSDKANWDNMIRADEILQPIQLKDWGFVYTERDEETAQQFISGLKRFASAMKIQVADPRIMVIENDRTETFTDAFKKILKPNFQIAVFMAPGNKKERYDKIKQLLTSAMPIPSQCIQTKTLQNEKRFSSVCTKICIQMQAKCGAQIWRVQIPITKFMVVGIDVYHDTVRKGESVLAFCASFNDNCTKYFSVPCFHRSGQEISANLGNCMHEALKFYFKQNNAFPEKIFIYRDGVGDGQVDAVHKMEIPHIIQAFTRTQADYNPKLAVIIVKKRISARFFEERVQANPPPGTVIDRSIVPKGNYSFYLVSQSVTQGSATPTQYQVVVDNTGLKTDHLQMLTYKLCHLYVNWSGTVRVPAPCQYAHKYALLVGQSIHASPNSRLCSTLHFL